MAGKPRALTQAELKGYAKAFREAGIECFEVEIERPDGTRISLRAGAGTQVISSADDIDAMIARAT